MSKRKFVLLSILKTWLISMWVSCGFLILFFSFFTITDENIGSGKVIVFLIMNLPWLAFWMFYYYRFNVHFNIINN
ncbi:hypothetical protein [Chryseobacterium sp. YR459]|uniref:hypothetical protein n=1 Tax=Chryseobacterium sp. HR92 TaxID=3094839 RepID=UPI0012E096C6|nr:hypothetical protein SFA27_17310 [Chryseobacterium sp. HR92]